MDAFSHAWLGGLFQDAEIEDAIGPDASMRNMLRVESAFICARVAANQISLLIGEQALNRISGFCVNSSELKKSTAKDGVIVPGLVRQLRADQSPEVAGAIHTGLTSQDVIDTALVLSLKHINALFVDRLSSLIGAIETLEHMHGKKPLMGRTRMQAAIEITVADRLHSWLAPFPRHIQRLETLQTSLEVIQLGGAVGTYAKNNEPIVQHMAHTLGLHPAPQWHTARDTIMEYAGLLSLISGSCGKIGTDIALMAQQGVEDIYMEGGGASSAMPHKQNPVLAELLVTLARFNAAQLGGMHGAQIHEQERSGVSWALEWMILPQMLQASGRALLTATKLLGQVHSIGQATASK